MQYQIKKIAGIDCLFAPMNEGNSITIDISFKAGSLYENEEEAGISHFLEHMFFKWGKKRKTPAEVAIAMDKIWAIFNAGTGKASTSYYIKCAPQFASYGLEMLADMLINATFQLEEMEREKGVVIQELKMYEDNPQSVLGEKWARFFFGDTPFGKPIIWTEESIQSFRREQLFAYKQALYTKDNLLITLAGKIENQEALQEQIAQLFSSLPEKKTRQKPDFYRSLPDQHSDFFTKKTEQNHLMIAMPGFTGASKEKNAARLLCTILWGNMSSRLFQHIREQLGLCYSINAGYGCSSDYGFFYISSGLKKSDFSDGVEHIHQEINKLISESFRDEELENAKNYLIWGIQMGIESSDEMADFLWDQYLHYGKIDTLEEIIQQYQSIQRSDLEALFPYLTRDKRWSYHIE